MDDSFNFKTFKTTLMRILLILLLLFLSACHKPVYTEYYEKENYSEFTTHPFLMEVPGYRILSVTASRRCPGKTICNPKEIKLTLRLETKFAYLQGKDFGILADGEKIDLNRRRYHFAYDIESKYKDGTTGFAIERWVVWIKVEEFNKVANGKKIQMLIGEEPLEVPSTIMETWRILVQKPLLLKTMDEEDQRSYGEYTEAPASESEVREKFEQKAFIEAEESTWKMVKDSENPEDLRFFLEQYPESPYATPARLKLKQMEREKN